MTERIENPHGEDWRQKVIEGMSRMNSKQQDFYVRLVRRIAGDEAFCIRLDRERSIFDALFRAENYPALEQWFTRKTLELIK